MQGDFSVFPPGFDLRLRRLVGVALGVALLAGGPAMAVPVTVTHSDMPTCDPLVVPSKVDELGTGLAFPAGESITAVHLGTPFDACAHAAARGVPARPSRRRAASCRAGSLG